MSSVIWYDLFCNLEALFSTMFLPTKSFISFAENFIIMKECVFNVSVAWEFIPNSRFH